MGFLDNDAVFKLSRLHDSVQHFSSTFSLEVLASFPSMGKVSRGTRVGRLCRDNPAQMDMVASALLCRAGPFCSLSGELNEEKLQWQERLQCHWKIILLTFSWSLGKPRCHNSAI